jgi:hypothetical protein
MRVTRTHTLILSAIALLGAAGPVLADDLYPVSGRWTFNDASAPGPSPDCRKPTMEFRGVQRFDTSGGVSMFRNKRIIQDSTTGTLYRVTDQFFNVMIRGIVTYRLRIRDEDHIEIDYDLTGKNVLLRRCA